MKFVVDAGPLVAATDRRDVAHGLARAIMSKDEPDLLVTDAIVAEVDYLLRKRVSAASARAFLDDVRADSYRRMPFGSELFGRAVKYDAEYAGLGLGIADGSVMALAEAERAPILTFDFSHFRATRPLHGGFWRLAIDERAFKHLVNR